MTNQHSIIPSPEQVDEWFDDAVHFNSTPKYYIAKQAALWGADQELEACCEWIPEYCPWDADKLRASRRPKPLSLKEQAYDALDAYIYGERDANDKERTYNIIRRALEALDD
jgi:hypothetical protein